MKLPLASFNTMLQFFDAAEYWCESLPAGTADLCHVACFAFATYSIDAQHIASTPNTNVPVQRQCQCPALDVSLLFQVRKLAPKHMQNDEAGNAARHAHVTCANFSRQGEIVATYNDEVHMLQNCTSTCICSSTASDIIPRQIASSPGK